MKYKWMLVFLLSSLVAVQHRNSEAGVFEISGSFSYYRSNFSPIDYTWKRRLGFSFGYYFTETSEVQVSLQDVFDKTFVTGAQDTEFHDQIYSLDWVQSFVGRDAVVQPYVKLGFGQLNRTATGTYANGGQPPAIYDALTIVMGAGIKLYVTKSFGIKGEATTYLSGGNIRTWQDNLSFSIGTSVYF